MRQVIPGRKALRAVCAVQVQMSGTKNSIIWFRKVCVAQVVYLAWGDIVVGVASIGRPPPKQDVNGGFTRSPHNT